MLECEAGCRKAGVLHLTRTGDACERDLIIFRRCSSFMDQSPARQVTSDCGCTNVISYNRTCKLTHLQKGCQVTAAIHECVSVGSSVQGSAINGLPGPVITASFLTDFRLALEATRDMKLTILKKLFKPSTVNISASPIVDVAGDSHDHTHYHHGDIYKKISIHSSQAGK